MYIYSYDLILNNVLVIKVPAMSYFNCIPRGAHVNDLSRVSLRTQITPTVCKHIFWYIYVWNIQGFYDPTNLFSQETLYYESVSFASCERSCRSRSVLKRFSLHTITQNSATMWCQTTPLYGTRAESIWKCTTIWHDLQRMHVEETDKFWRYVSRIKFGIWRLCSHIVSSSLSRPTMPHLQCASYQLTLFTCQ